MTEASKRVVRCLHSATLFKLASWTAITWPVPFAYYVALLLVRKEAGSNSDNVDDRLWSFAKAYYTKFKGCS